MASTRTVTFINAFEVPPDADDAFIAGWKRARDVLAANDAVASTALHRALRTDVRLRFIEVARVESTDARERAIGDPEFPGTALPFPAHPAVFDVVHENGEPDGLGGVVFINPCAIPAGEDERFVAGWERVRGLFAARQGYLGARLHRSLAPADFRFVAIVRWSSPLMFARTLQQPEVARATAAMPSPGGLYLVIQG